MRKNRINSSKCLWFLGVVIVLLVSRHKITTTGTIFFILGYFSIVYIVTALIEGKNYNTAELEKTLKGMTAKQFSVFVSNLFKELGYSTQLTTKDCNEGKDVVIKGNGKLIYIDCKHWKHTENVGKRALQRLVANTIQHYGGIKRAIIVTTGEYNKDVYEYVECMKWYMRLDLWSIKDVIREFNRIDDNKKEYILNGIE